MRAISTLNPDGDECDSFASSIIIVVDEWLIEGLPDFYKLIAVAPGSDDILHHADLSETGEEWVVVEFEDGNGDS
jgi:hypothetical protein